jgi:septal ring factor EnvC (AmiA/AmiB activator)
VRAALPLLLILLAAPAQAQSLDERRRALEALNQRERALSAEIGANRNALARLLSALQLFSRDPPPPLLVSPGDAKDAVRAMILAKAITPQLQVRAKALAMQAEALAQARRQAAEASGDLFAAESEIEDREGRLSAVAADADLMAPPGARQAASALDAAPAPVTLARPADGPPAVRFGGRLPGGLRSKGLAWKMIAGSTVRSPAAAVVAYAGPLAGWGQVVILRAGGGCHMVLSGLGKVSVTAGQSVAASSPLGTMPTSGHAPLDLYFEVRLAGGPIDPASLMGR